MMSRETIEEVCPKGQLSSMFMRDVESAVNDVFKKINYKPKNLKKSLDKTWKISKRDDPLSEFVYTVWRIDNGH